MYAGKQTLLLCVLCVPEDRDDLSSLHCLYNIVLFFFSSRFGSRGKEDSDANKSTYKVRNLSFSFCLVFDFLVFEVSSLEWLDKLMDILARGYSTYGYLPNLSTLFKFYLSGSHSTTCIDP
jgi:hypothetical protein